MFDAFSIALSGLAGNGSAVDVIGNNLANLNTPGFKGSVVSFQDLMALSLDTSRSQVGSGIGAPQVVRQFLQGSIQATGNPLDAAIQGQGFFVVRSPSGETLYTRAGNFHLDADGKLLTLAGEIVQGWTAVKGVLNTSGAAGNIVIPLGAVQPPTVTTKMSLDLNLDAGAPKDATFSTPITVVDSLGGTHVLTVTFTKTDKNSWKYQVFIPGEDLASGTAGKPSEISGAAGTLTFAERG